MAGESGSMSIQLKLDHLLLAALFGALPLTAAAEGGSSEDQCYICHLEDADDQESPASTFVDDIHFRKNLGCAACHGGNSELDDPDEAMSEDAGFIGVPDRKDIPEMCGKCHADLQYMRAYNPSARTDQVDEYFTSVHGRKLLEGDENVATCADCHDVHRIRPADEPRSSIYPTNIPSTCGRCHSNPGRMKPYGIPTDQVEQYSQSVHGIALMEKHDLAAPTCNDCHGNHGAAPPGVESVAYVCGMCHASENELFQKGPKGRIFRELELPGCVSCHTHHSILKPTNEMISFQQGGLCLNCHDPGDKLPRATGVAIRSLLDTLAASYDEAQEKTDEAEQKGMDVSEALFLLKDAKQKIFESRSYLHTFNADELRPHAEEGIKISRMVLAQSEKAIHDYSYRRRGFAVSTILLTILAVALYLKIRSLD